MHWDRPCVLFPEIEIDTMPYKGLKSPEFKAKMLTVPDQRMCFYMAKNGVLLTLSFYGLAHDRHASYALCCRRSSPGAVYSEG